MKARCIVCALAASLVMSLVASFGFGEGLPAEASKPKTRVVYKEKSYYDFEDSLVNGNLRKPDGSFVYRKNQSSFSSALNLKRSFIPELRESAKSAR